MADFSGDSNAELVATLLEASPVGMLLVDHSMHVAYSNAHISEMFAWPGAELKGRSILSLIPSRYHERHRSHELRYMAKPKPKGMQFDRDLLACRKDGSEFPVEISLYPISLESGDYVLVGVLDVSDKLRVSAVEALNERLSETASVDSLTGLPNRRTILQRLSRSITELRREADSLSVVFLDLDGFKSVNDEFGHAVGDDVLIQVANVLIASVRHTDLVGRLGGDEFLLILHNAGGEAAVRQLAAKLIADIEAIDHCEQKAIHISASIGAVSFTASAALSAVQAVKIADELMYDAKRKGKARLEYLNFDGEIQPC